MTEPTTPLMQQYHAVKKQYPAALVLFRLGDFYELFYEDAVVASRILQITLTARNKEKDQAVPMCGVPFHAAESYISRLIRAGHKVAICEQMEQPGPGKKIVRREVIRVLTPGTASGAGLTAEKENNYLAAVARGKKPAGGREKLPGRGLSEETVIGLAYVDLSTGEFKATEFSGEKAEAKLADELGILRPREILVVRPAEMPLFPAEEKPALAPSGLPPKTIETKLEDWIFRGDYAARILEEQFRVAGLAGFGLDGHAQAVAASGAIVHYLRETSAIGARNPEDSAANPTLRPKGTGLEHLDRIVYYQQRDAMILDQVTARNLELVEPDTGEDLSTTLAGAIDETATGMGARLLRNWVLRPEITTEEIAARLGAVADLKAQTVEREEIYRELSGVLDLERLTSRVTLGVVTPRDLLALKSSLERIPVLRARLSGTLGRLGEIREHLDEMGDVRDEIARGIADSPPAAAGEPGVIREGFSAELDEFREITRHGRQIIASMEDRERKRTGIASLKIRFNQVFGFYIEISKPNLHLVPADFERKQTLVNAERFTTPELKDHERKVLSAEGRILEIERKLYGELREHIASEASRLRKTAAAVAQLDVLVNFARIAAARKYVRPEFTEEVKNGQWRKIGAPVAAGQANEAAEPASGPPANRGAMIIAGGRHPVIEKLLQERGERFVPNDLYLDDHTQFLLTITGPNMGGKSTYLRQTALISIMAQMGSFVPATQAKLPIVDRVFTRIGASDNLARGRSTFLVEMSEVGAILNTATPASLVLLDEVGRGTATFDGLSIAWAVVEALHSGARPRTLFATHYHELTELAELLPGIENVHVSVQEAGSEIVFLRRVEPGSADKSYGIEVARLAGLPHDVIVRAREILRKHEQSEERLTEELSPGAALGLEASGSGQKSFTAIDESVLQALRQAELDRLTPLEALNLLAALQKQLS
jgi:DNA mismatch repair protein MutS